jgi:hypothetical protein
MVRKAIEPFIEPFVVVDATTRLLLSPSGEFSEFNAPCSAQERQLIQRASLRTDIKERDQ